MTLPVNFPALLFCFVEECAALEVAGTMPWGVNPACGDPQKAASILFSEPPAPVSWEVAGFSFPLLWGALPVPAATSYSLCCHSPFYKNLKVASLQLNVGVNWLSASYQILVLLLAVSTGSLGRKKMSLTRQSIQARRQCWALCGDL